MADLADIRAGLAANLASISGFQISPYLLSSPTLPAIEIEPGQIEYDKSMARALDYWYLIVRAFVAFTTDIGAQKRIDACMAASGASSVKEAIESDSTLGGVAQDLSVTKCSGYKMFMREVTAAGRGSVSGPIIGAEWTVWVIARGDS